MGLDSKYWRYLRRFVRRSQSEIVGSVSGAGTQGTISTTSSLRVEAVLTRKATWRLYVFVVTVEHTDFTAGKRSKPGNYFLFSVEELPALPLSGQVLIGPVGAVTTVRSLTTAWPGELP